MKQGQLKEQLQQAEDADQEQQLQHVQEQLEQPVHQMLLEQLEQVQQEPLAENLVCMICGEHQVEGIHICDEFICDSCEREIVHTDVQDSKYAFFIHRMKQIFQSKNA